MVQLGFNLNASVEDSSINLRLIQANRLVAVDNQANLRLRARNAEFVFSFAVVGLDVSLFRQFLSERRDKISESFRNERVSGPLGFDFDVLGRVKTTKDSVV